MEYHIEVFGCAANTADAQRIAAMYASRGWKKAESVDTADVVVLVSCMIRESAEHRIYGNVRNLAREKKKGRNVKIVVTGCMVGMAARDKTGKMLASLKRKMPEVDEFMPVSEVGYDYPQLREDGKHALVMISNGCNNFCTYCVVPYSRGREVSRPYGDIIAECRDLAGRGYTSITLVGQNVNSYGSDLVSQSKSGGGTYALDGRDIEPVFVKHLGRLRIPTLFPYLLDDVARIPGLTNVDFISSNPWDFSDELIECIARNPVVSRTLHLPVQSGDGAMLRKMNRWYTPEEYIALTEKIKTKVPGVRFSTDIIVGYCGETTEQFENTVVLCRKVGFSKAYVAMYSDRPMTVAHKSFTDDVPHAEKKRRWEILDALINRENLKNGTYAKTDRSA